MNDQLNIESIGLAYLGITRNRPVPLKVALQSKEEVNALLKNKKKN